MKLKVYSICITIFALLLLWLYFDLTVWMGRVESSLISHSRAINSYHEVYKTIGGEQDYAIMVEMLKANSNIEILNQVNEGLDDTIHIRTIKNRKAIPALDWEYISTYIQIAGESGEITCGTSYINLLNER